MNSKKIIVNTSSYLTLVILIIVSFSSIVNAQVIQDSVATQPRRQSGGFFTGGNAAVSWISSPPEINSGVAKVSFPAGVRTIWHAHAGGQIIVVVSGTAWYQEKGKAKQIILQGEAVVCPPNVMHWHGASADAPMVHTVATPNLNKGGATSGDPVTEQEYRAPVN
ncbi:cupin domain-containing protein [Pedobacter cryotolerans]|uniref:Cupin domain-containing protein n=1 Tax=Pedobacter cryotolerans TaxID=2571270 RepID=A0A4U1C6A5_9SPHI|nr:cupin domain-containing protein [Pedobacter cryotolerans]TKC01548.1 cupin domain-containing protein [Pedobacter cryotolerans]